MDSDTQKKLAEAIIKYAPSKKEVATLVGELVKQLREVHKELDNSIKSTDTKAISSIESLKTDVYGELEGVKKLIDQSTNSSKVEALNAIKNLGETSNLTVEEVRNELALATKNLTKFISDTTKKSSDELYKTINREVYGLDKKIGEIPPFDPTQLEAKWSAVIEGIQQTPVPETTLDILAIRDGLESLIGDDRFDVDAINGLNELQTKWTNAVLETVNTLLSAKQNTLVSGTNIKTINGDSILGSGDLTVTGSGISRTIVVTSGDTTLGGDASTDYVCLVNGNHVITMPTAVSNTNQYSIKNLHSAAITVNTTSSQTIDGTTTIQISPEDSVDLASNNSNWFII